VNREHLAIGLLVVLAACAAPQSVAPHYPSAPFWGDATRLARDVKKINKQPLFVGVGNNAYPKAHIYVFGTVSPSATPSATITINEPSQQKLWLSSIGVDPENTLYTPFGDAAWGTTMLTGNGINPAPSWAWVIAGKDVYNATGQSSFQYFSASEGACGSKCFMIAGDNTMLSSTITAAIDKSGKIYVSDLNTNSIFVFAKNASGDVPPIRMIHGPHTGLGQADSMAVDSKGRLWIMQGGYEVLRFPPDANGDITPQTITMPPGGITRLAIDTGDNVYVDMNASDGDSSWVQVIRPNGKQFSMTLPFGLGDVAQSIAVRQYK